MPTGWSRGRRLGAALATVIAVGCNGNGDDGGNGNGGRWQTVEELRVTMTGDDLQTLYSRDPAIDDRLPAEVLLPGEDSAIETDGIRFRGSNSRTYPRKSLDIELLEPHPFVFENERREGGTRLQLNAMWTDATAMREHLAFQLHREMGLPAPRTQYADVYLNDVLEGLHINIERVDEDFLDNNGLESGEGRFLLVRDETKDSALVPQRSAFGLDLDTAVGGTDEEMIAALQELFDSEGDEAQQDWAPLLELIRWVHDTEAGPDFEAGICERFDIENLRTFLAINALLQDVDSLDVDYWLYREASEGAKWRLIPWDKNLTFGTVFFENAGGGANDYLVYDAGFINPLENALIERILETPGLRAEIDDRIRELVTTGEFSRERFEEEIERLRPEIEPRLERVPGPDAFVLTPKQHVGEDEFAAERFDALLDFVELRSENLLRRIDDIPSGVGDLTVERRLESVDAGTRVHFTDAFGWVIATFVPDTTIQDATVTVSAAPVSGVDGVNRSWTVDTGGATLNGKLTLYYRNTPDESWTGSTEAVGRERDLVLVDVTDTAESFESTVNPFINRVSADVGLEGTHTFQLRYEAADVPPGQTN